MRYHGGMDTIRQHDSGPAVEDVQRRLVKTGYLAEGAATGVFDAETVAAVRAFTRASGMAETAEVNDKVWAALVDASYSLGDRTLYLRMPYFHGNDVVELQQALGALGFSPAAEDGIFGAYTEDALRAFQLNLGLPDDGIAGALTYAAIKNLHHSWEGKHTSRLAVSVGFARAADALESNALCLFGTDAFSRDVAARMANLALATNPASKVLSADTLLVPPDEDMLLVHLVLPGGSVGSGVPLVVYDDDSLALRLESAIRAARKTPPHRIAVQLPGTMWEDAGEDRSAQHFAITLLDALCAALQ